MTENTSPEVRVSMATGLIWEFAVSSSATTCAEQAEEMVNFCEQLYSAFGEFLVPIEISYGIRIFEQDTEVRPDSDTGTLVSRHLQEDNGVDVSTFVESTKVDEVGIRWIPRIPFERNGYKVHFNGSDYAIKRRDCTPYRKGKPRQEIAIPDPLDLSVTHRPARNFSAVNTDHVLTVSIAMNSDLWLRASKNGDRNRAYLVSFFEDIAEITSAEAIKRDKYRTNDFWNDLSVYSNDDDYIDLVPEAIY